MRIRLTYLRSTLFVGLLTAFNLVFLHFSKQSATFTSYSATVHRFSPPVLVWTLVTLSIAGFVYSARTYSSQSGRKVYDYNGILGMMPDFVYVFSLVVFVGAILTFNI